jgi:TRAP-type uncharacterized transport system fused permease subunit
VPAYEQVKTGVFFLSVLFLIVLMGWAGTGELLAALYTAAFMFVLLLATYLLFRFVLRDPVVIAEDDPAPEPLPGYLIVIAGLVMAYLLRDSVAAAVTCLVVAAVFAVLTLRVPALISNFRETVETHADMTSYLTLLLATLGIMIGLFTVTGFINRMGAMLLDLGAWNVMAMIFMAYIFGWLVGAGLPPTATYIIGAVVIVGPLRELGVNPWVAHFFVFLLSVWGELSPPTSLTAAVSARIAEASFIRTMWEALKICLPITLMTFAIFTREDLVVNPGWPQLIAGALVLIGTLGISLAMFGRMSENAAVDVGSRVLIALVSLVVMFHPNDTVAEAVSPIVVLALLVGLWRHRLIAPPKSLEGEQAEDADHSGDLAGLMAEAKREI